jgi:hypothetical protein
MSNISTAKALRRRIMRRVWYAYTLSLTAQPLFWHGIALGGGVMLLAELIWVQRVVASFLETPVGDAPAWLWGRVSEALGAGEFFLLCVLGIVIMTALSAGTRLLRWFLRPLTTFGPVTSGPHWSRSG